MPGRRTARHTSASNADRDALTLLRRDHARLVELFASLAAKPRAADGREGARIEHACRELEMHARLEAELFYPALVHARAAGPWLEDGAVEHAMLDGLMEELRMLPSTGARWAATARVLAEVLAHHLAKEEERVFPLAQATGVDLVGLGELLASRWQELTAQQTRARGKIGGRSPRAGAAPVPGYSPPF